MTFFPLEAGLTAALWDLFSGDGPPECVAIMIDQLDANDPRVQEFTRRRAETGSRSWLPRYAPGADLAIITPDDESEQADVLAMLEIKLAASTNWPTIESALKFPALDGETAAAIIEDYASGSSSSSSTICQADLYRSRKWWPDEANVRMDGADRTLWLLLDARGRQPHVAFAGASRPDAWQTIDLQAFARDLRSFRKTTNLTDAHSDQIAVVLWHIEQAAPSSANVEPDESQHGLRPALSELVIDSETHDIIDSPPEHSMSIEEHIA